MSIQLLQRDISKRYRLLISVVVISLFILSVSAISSVAEEGGDGSPPAIASTAENESLHPPSTGQNELIINEAGAIQKKIPGIGSTLGRMLDKLISITGNSENQIQSILTNFPIILPDLYKVFITL